MLSLQVGQLSSKKKRPQRVPSRPFQCALREGYSRGWGGGGNDHPGWVSPIHVFSSQKVQVLKELEEKVSSGLKKLNHLDQFPKNLGAVSDEQGKDFYEDFKKMMSSTKAAGANTWWRIAAGVSL
ncbi:hypothetical protein AVEN_214608-1 [Araneus ventricosus]|uniref:Uncharacterized protein n=1 Tax=Araneus ventricosus TaxID=182803 RepID=A0A4Y2PJ48_ARAVE|nr:hypothetical protein AVEN_90215-1 [Araneus ventricosus]GBN51995.1 hypothetical protein AVEN_214608-1 [Araneus ventricosus]